jgi:hypothetical protein
MLARSPLKPYTQILVRLQEIPDSKATVSLPPIAYTERPKVVRFSTSWKTAIAKIMISRGTGRKLKSFPVVYNATPRETLPPGIERINRLTPCHTTPVAKVTISGGKPPRVIMNPFTKPTASPIRVGTRSHKIIFPGVFKKGRLTATTFASPMVAPMDRSIPPVRMTNVWAIPTRISGVILVKRLTLLFHVKNVGSIKEATRYISRKMMYTGKKSRRFLYFSVI